jgi:hypothetical protein
MWDFEEISNHWSTYGSSNTADWFSISFDRPIAVNRLKAWFFADNKRYRLPHDVKVEYYNMNGWKEVALTNPDIELLSNTLNDFRFKSIRTDKLRIQFKNPGRGFYTAISEMEVY